MKLASSGKLDTLTGDFMYLWVKPFTIDLPNGSELEAGENSTENKLYQFLTDPSAKFAKKLV